MINNSEENIVKLSPTKKDFYQIWNELLETASKISERWDPNSTNESDPGIVLLKVLTATADKLNYQIDANTNEVFMPSAAQEESMRKLCDMLGYNMKYYQSATTDVQITYNNSNTIAIPEDKIVWIDKFTNIKDIDDTINYVTLETKYLNRDTTSVIVPCIEGELIECETENNNIITRIQLDDNNRYYLPETQIAENGIFITNIDNNEESEEWEPVCNLNTQSIGKKCYKFGYDSKENLPYIQFPEDIDILIEDGLKIKYIRTNGINGNISARTLCKMSDPESWSLVTNKNEDEASETADYYNVDNYTVFNSSASKNGKNKELINDAYNNYKKTIGTFDTLVNCRDYMNKIYQLTTSATDTTNLVSNIIVSDIRDDINKAMTLCTFGDYGIEYKTVAKAIDTSSSISKNWEQWLSQLELSKSFTYEDWNDELNKLYKVTKDGVISYYRAIFTGNDYNYSAISTRNIECFDLVFYPFKNVYGLNTKSEYTKSFKYDETNLAEIKEEIEDTKTLSHNIISPNKDDIACIKNYYKLNAKITTTRKVNFIEQNDILSNVYKKIYETFNMRHIDFGEEIPYDAILECIENADSRIKSVSLEDPELYTKFCSVGGGEYQTSNESTLTSGEFITGNKYYNKTVLNNIMAGRVPLFDYNTSFEPNYNEIPYSSWNGGSYNLLYPETLIKTSGIKTIKPRFNIKQGAKNLKLQANEVIQFRAPNMKTTATYPAYVNYYLHLNDRAEEQQAIPATMYEIYKFLAEKINDVYRWQIAANSDQLKESVIQAADITSAAKFEELVNTEANISQALAGTKKYYAVFEKKSNNEYIYANSYKTNTLYYRLDITNENFGYWASWIHTQDTKYQESGQAVKMLEMIYYPKTADLSKSFGVLVDKAHRQFLEAKQYRSDFSLKPFEKCFVQQTWASDLIPSASVKPEDSHTKDGLGQDAIFSGIAANEEYQLKPGEYLLINYTSATSNEGTDKNTVFNIAYYGSTSDIHPKGDIIKPNFELIDSLKYRSLHSYNKTSGFDFKNVIGADSEPAGMFTLGTNEQIEIRDLVEVKLDQIATNIYWERNDEVVGNNDKIYFEFNEPDADGNANMAYTLKDGEHFYYTNKDKTDIIYYGTGTRITRTPYTPQIYKSSKDTKIDAETIATNGLNAAIPWRPYNFSTPSTGGVADNSLTLVEFMYINLKNGNVLNSVSATQNESQDIEIDLNNEWREINSAVYTIDGSINTLPKISLVSTNKNWAIRTKLEANLGPKTTQILNVNTENNNVVSEDSFILSYNSASINDVTIKPQNNKAVALKANKVIQSASDTINVYSVKIGETGGIIDIDYNCQLKVFEVQETRDIENNNLNLNNANDGIYTKLSFKQISGNDDGNAFAKLNLLIPSVNNNYGLIMIYNSKIGTGENAGIKLIKASGTSTEPNAPKHFNEVSWSGGSYTKDLYAVEGQVFIKPTAEEFNNIKTAANNNVYTRTTITTKPESNSLISFDGTVWYRYTKASTYTANTNYYYLLSNGGESTIYTLKNGINIIQIDSSCKLEFFPDTEAKDILIFSNLNIVNGINKKLNYKKIDDTVTADVQILKDIKSIDPEFKFYYNAPKNSEIILDLNELNEKDTLESPMSWFDYNNINNKFVVSEIDAEYLSTGISIARSSKLDY